MHRIGCCLLIALLSALPGCATLNQSDCLRGDWYAIGAADGRHGYSPQRLTHHAKACAKHGVGVDGPAYDAGFIEGLHQFCVPPRAFSLGRENGSYHRLCPADAEPAFLAAYDLGRDAYAIEQELAELDKEITALRKEIDDENSSDNTRELAEQRLRYVKNDRNRRERDHDALLERARRLGYGNVW